MLSLFMALRYTASRRHSQLVSFISRLSIAGLIISVALLVLVLSVMNGFDKELRQRILAILPQAAILHVNNIDDWPSLRAWLQEREGVVDAAPFVELSGMAEYRRNVAPMLLTGLAGAEERGVSAIEDYLSAGEMRVLRGEAGRGSVLLGSGLADELQVEPGNRLKFIIPRGDGADPDPRAAGLEVAGVVHTGTEMDQNMALTDLATAQELAGLEEHVTGLKLRLTDLFAAETLVYPIVRELPAGYTSTTWMRSKGNLYQAIQMSRNLVGLLLFLIIGIAAFNLVSTLVMVTVDKQGDIAILRTLGASSGRIMSVFMIQGSIIGLLGTTIGLLLGVGLALGVEEAVAWLEALLNFQFLQSDVYPISFVPSAIRIFDLLAIAAVALFLSFVATLYPAWRASRVNPAEALRFEV